MMISLRLPNHAVDPNEEIIAFGDIHGHAHLLCKALAKVSALPIAPGKRRKLVFLGDLIDRGPDSLGTIDLALEAKRLPGVQEIIYLMGNHEHLLSYALRSIPRAATTMNPLILSDDELHSLTIWLANGGDSILGTREIAELPGLIGPTRRAWLANLRPFYVSGGIMFVHAGLAPHLPLSTILAAPADIAVSNIISRSHWASIREPFLSHEPDISGHHGYFVVHGHTTRDPLPDALSQVQRSRINLDGGSYSTGIIRFARLQDCFIDLYEIGGE